MEETLQDWRNPQVTGRYREAPHVPLAPYGDEESALDEIQSPYQLLLNGQTGKIAGQRPADWRKIGLLSAGLILPGLLLFLFFLIFLPEVYGAGGGFWTFFVFLAGLLVSIAIAWQAQRLDKI